MSRDIAAGMTMALITASRGTNNMIAVAGDVFSGRFEIQHRAGSGGMGAVYRAHDRLRDLTLLDFGIARRSVRASAITRTGLVIETPEYLSPEQRRGVRELERATDIFSLGCVSYECLTGSPPFATSQLTRFCQVHLALGLSLHEDPATRKLACALARFAITDKSSPALLGVAYGALARALFRLAEPAQAAATARRELPV